METEQHSVESRVWTASPKEVQDSFLCTSSHIEVLNILADRFIQNFFFSQYNNISIREYYNYSLFKSTECYFF